MLLHDQSIGVVNAPPGVLFQHLDDPRRLGGHMSRSSAMMLGSRMTIELDEADGRRVGSRIRLVGRIVGIPIAVEEVISEHVPPRRKVWQTIGTPRLLVLSHYTMGFEITPEGPPRACGSSSITVSRPAVSPDCWGGCSDPATLGGAPNRWSTTPLPTFVEGPPPVDRGALRQGWGSANLTGPMSTRGAANR